LKLCTKPSMADLVADVRGKSEALNFLTKGAGMLGNSAVAAGASVIEDMASVADAVDAPSFVARTTASKTVRIYQVCKW
jgi:hypothetical protein